jgi:cyclophilin family peptidyl-prolyl cis-trans isomerase
MPSHRRRIHRSRRSKKPLIIAGFLVAVIAIAVVAFYVMSTATYTLTVYTVGQGSIMPNNGTYSPGTTVDLAAIDTQEWPFYGWSGDTSGSENTSITMNDDMVVTANFIERNNTVRLITSMGNITILLRDDMPITTENFKNLTALGIYNNTIFHRVIADFMIQGGDPTGTGYGDPSISSIQDEFGSNNHNVRGTVAMAKTSEANSATSQFFINVVNNGASSSTFDSTYSVFGDVIDGMDVVDAISQLATDSNDRPVDDVILYTVLLLD